MVSYLETKLEVAELKIRGCSELRLEGLETLRLDGLVRVGGGGVTVDRKLEIEMDPPGTREKRFMGVVRSY